MTPSRRRLLSTLGMLPVAGFTRCTGPAPAPIGGPTDSSEAGPDRGPKPPPWDPPGAVDEAPGGAFPFGVAAGDPTSDAVLLSVRTREPAVTLVVVHGVDGGWTEVDRREGLTPVDGVLQVEVDGLEADAVYRYVFLTGDGLRRSRPGRFRTALAAGGLRKLVIGATSCLGSDNPTFPSLLDAAKQDVDVMLLLGDTVYADGAVTLDDYRAVWDEALSVESVRALFASTGLVATWDDHEVANNWTTGEGSEVRSHVELAQVAAGDQAFREGVPQRIAAGGTRWRSLVWGDTAEILVLDSRGERDWVDHIVSDAQLAWVQERLRASTAAFKLVLVSVHITDHTELMATIQAEDRWQGYAAQREALLATAEGVSGVVFVTGDMHYGAIQKVSPAGAVGADLWEIAAGPAGSELFFVEALSEFSGGLPAQYVDALEAWTWARLVLDPGTGDVVVQLIDGDGAVLAEETLRP